MSVLKKVCIFNRFCMITVTTFILVIYLFSRVILCLNIYLSSYQEDLIFN